MNYYDREEISNSDLDYATWADLMQARKDRKEGKIKTSDAMECGTLFHSLVLEGKVNWTTDEGICSDIGGKKPRNTNAYKDWLKLQT